MAPDRNSTKNHECLRNKDFQDYYAFKESFLKFMGGKEVTNGYINNEFKELNQRLDDLENKLYKLIFLFLSVAITSLSSMIIMMINMLKP